jgi:hypothetical protein
MTCDTAQFSCFAACAINELLCMWTTNGAATSLLILGFNIATLGMGAPATGAATVAIKTEHGGTRPVSGTTNVGKAMVTLANTMQTTDTKVVAVGKAVYNSRTGELRSNVAPKVATGVSETYKVR